ncbi:hypothetical protein C0431_07005 [bacterium]|jgi:uncharacterized protein|nr:hypothetical protein [bacterium]
METVVAFVEESVKQLVNEPDEVKVDTVSDRHGQIIKVTVSPNDVGRIIGKDGRVITNLRTMTNAVAAKARVKAVVKVQTED